jgi:hypothetical protein
MNELRKWFNMSIIIITILSFLLVGGVFAIVSKRQVNHSVNEVLTQEKIRVAACPTCFDIIKNINTDKYEVIKTNSTAESLVLLQDQKVDMILAGRTLKSSEPQLDRILIKEGYSFLSEKNMTVHLDQLKDRVIYTDLDIGMMKNDLSLQKIERVSNVYDYVDKGIVVTSWENTDHTKANIVHVLEKSGKRFALSRQPTIYCPHVCGHGAQEIALSIK